MMKNQNQSKANRCQSIYDDISENHCFVQNENIVQYLVKPNEKNTNNEEKKLKTFDFTMDYKANPYHRLGKLLKNLCDEYVIQHERAPSGYEHWQARIKTKMRYRYTTMVKKINKIAVSGSSKRVSITHTHNINNYQYVTKDNTRIGEPICHNVILKGYIPIQYRMMTTMRPFQQNIIERCSVKCPWDCRTINVVYNTIGNVGKSKLVGYMRSHKLARPIPPQKDQRDILRMVCDCPVSNAYLIDLPRAMKKDKMWGLWSAIEIIKDGYAYDDRHKFKEKEFDVPHIWVFTNFLPEKDGQLLSDDRWKIWTIGPEYNLIPWMDKRWMYDSD